MDLTSKMLRDVEFRDRLRGYDTDEVDEFLERVAVGVDELHAELMAAKSQQVAVPEPPPARSPLEDDDSIRRTLILAQRTADLAIAEAKEEADRLLDEARAQSSRLVGGAQETARRIESEAELELNQRVARLTEQRELLEHDVRTLSALVDSERSRLAATLDMLQSQVSGLKVSAEFGAATTHSEPEVSAPPEAPQQPFLADDPSVAEESADLELDLDISAITSPNAPVSGQVSLYPPSSEAPSANDEPEVDEALWERWASSADPDKSADDPFRFGDSDQ